MAIPSALSLCLKCEKMVKTNATSQTNQKDISMAFDPTEKLWPLCRVHRESCVSFVCSGLCEYTNLQEKLIICVFTCILDCMHNPLGTAENNANVTPATNNSNRNNSLPRRIILLSFPPLGP